MTPFLRKLYYLKATGAVLVSTQMSGAFAPTMIPEDWDFEHEQALQPYADRRDEVGLFLWQEPDPAIEAEFGSAYGVSVDVAVDPPAIRFDHTPPPPPPAPPNDADLILNIIKGVPSDV